MEAINHIKAEVLPLLKKYQVIKAGIFGSYATGEQTSKSDVDMLVEFPKGKSLFDLVRLEDELEKKLKKKVDLLTYRSIHKLLKERILREEVRIL